MEQKPDTKECVCCSFTKSCSTLWPHGLQYARLPCPSPSPRIFSQESSPTPQFKKGEGVVIKKGHEEVFRVLRIFYFLIWMLMRQSCSVYEDVLKCTLMKGLPVCMFVTLEQYFSICGIVAHQGTVGNIQRHFWLSQLEEGGTSNPVGRDCMALSNRFTIMSLHSPVC